MRLFSKVFFYISAILCLSLAVSGYLFMSASFRDSMANETERALETYRMTRYLLQSALGSKSALEAPDAGMIEKAAQGAPHVGEIVVFDEAMNPIYAELEGELSHEILPDLPDIDNTSVICAVRRYADRRYLIAGGVLYLSEHKLYLTVSEDVTTLFSQSERQMTRYRVIYLAVCALGLTAVGVTTAMIVRPIERAAKSAGRIARGDYRARVKATGDDELGDLARAFNAMAYSVDRSVEALEANAREKEDFVGNFAHELKTPLTSVIGYADMLTQKNIDEETSRTYAQYILDEGLRLEALSYKLMELIVLNKQDFVLEALPAREIFQNITESVRPLMLEKKILLTTDIDEAYLHVEFDLFKTALLNLIDNAAKADATRIAVSGYVAEPDDEASYLTGAPYAYAIEITDDGRGMPKEALDRITEAFYMVDKSRSRAQHGAGLGLALVSKIASLHRAQLRFESELGRGTTVRVVLPLLEEDVG